MKKSFLLILVYLLLTSGQSYGNIFFIKEHVDDSLKVLDINFSVSTRMRSTIVNFLHFGYIKEDIWIPYDYEKNIQTPALGPKLALNYSRVGFDYRGFVRYGYLHHIFDNTQPSGAQNIKTWLYDQQAHLSYAVNIHTRRRLAPRHVLAGYGSINTGKRFFLRNGPYNQYIDLQINTLDVGIGFEPLGPCWPITFTTNYMYQGMAKNRVDRFVSCTLALDYRFAQLRLGRN